MAPPTHQQHHDLKQPTAGHLRCHVGAAERGGIWSLALGLNEAQPSARRTAVGLIGAAREHAGAVLSDLVAAYLREEDQGTRGDLDRTIRLVALRNTHLMLSTAFLPDGDATPISDDALLERLAVTPRRLQSYSEPSIHNALAEQFAEALGRVAAGPRNFFREVVNNLELAAPYFQNNPKQVLGELLFATVRCLTVGRPADFGLADIEQCFKVLG